MNPHPSRAPKLALVFVIAFAAIAQTCPPGSGGGTPPPPAVTPIAVAPDPSDPAPTPAPAGAPFMYTQVLKFKIPTGTIFEVAEEGWLLPSSGTANCGDDGCYTVLSSVNNGAGSTTYVIQAWPQAYKRFANQLEYEITNVSVNSGFTGAQLASPAYRQIILAAVPPGLGGTPLPSGVHGTPEWAANNEQIPLAFITIGLSTLQDAQAYYAATGAPGDFTTWKTNNGFAANNDSKDNAKAYYFNAGDLAFGRSMHMKLGPNGIAYYVSNYPTVNNAIRNTNLIATVAMEYTPGPNGAATFMKFAVYKFNGTRQFSADLDGNGQKYVPNLCIICHGLRKYPGTGSANVGARFLPFDLSNFQYDQTIGRNSQEAAFKQLNLGMLQHSNPSVAMTALINAWYNDPSQASPNTATATQNNAAVPADWTGGTQAQTDMYLRVVKPSCRSCHITRNGALAFGKLTDFTLNNTYGSLSKQRVCSDLYMPNAKVTYVRFWLTHLQQYGDPAGVMKAAGLNTWNAQTACPS